MANLDKSKTLFFLGILIVVGILFLGPKLGLFSISGELGWIPYTTLDNQFTNLSITHGAQTGTTSSGIPEYDSFQFLSRYWTISRTTGSTGLPGITGGDKNINIQGDTKGVNILFNENLYQKNFAIDYSTGAANCGTPVSFTLMGETVSCGGSGKIEIKPSIINNNEASLYINGQKIKTLDVSTRQLFFTGSINSQYGSAVTLTNPRYKPLFDCALDNDEVLIFDEFVNGSTFSINDLTYPVQKFCVNQPAVIRSFTDRGIAVDSDGQILIKLSEGGSVTVARDQTIRVPYITKTQTGLLRCPTSEAYNPQTNACVNILGEGLVDIKGSFISTLDIGESEVGYKQNYQSSALQIGDISFNPSEQKYDDVKCGCDKTGRTYIDSVDKSCWYVNYNLNKITSGNSYKINNYLTVYYTATGYGIFNGQLNGINYNCAYTEPSDWLNLYSIAVDKNGLKIINGSYASDIKLNTLGDFKVTLNNSLANFQSSGFKVRTTENILDRITDQDISMSFLKGVKTYGLQIPQRTLGDIDIEVIPYVIIDGKKIYGSSKVVFKYSVISDQIQKDQIGILNQTLNEKLALIEQYQGDIAKQIEILNQLSITREEQGKLIEQLNLNIADQITMINGLTTNLAEKAKIVDQLNLNIAEQAQMINTLTSNLQEKIALVDTLTANTVEQAQLISAMRLSFADQANIINGLNLVITDDAKIVSGLRLNLTDQGKLLNEMKLTISEDAQLISSLNLKVSEEQTIIDNLNLNIEQKQQLINELKILNENRSNWIDLLNSNKFIIIAVVILLLILFLTGGRKR